MGYRQRFGITAVKWSKFRIEPAAGSGDFGRGDCRHGYSIAHSKTNEFLRREQEKFSDSDYLALLRNEDVYFAKEYQDEEHVSIVLSDIEFETELRLDLGGVTAVLFHTESPHSEDTVCIYVPEEKVLFLGDSTSEDFFNHGYMDKGKLDKLIKMIADTDCIYCVLSHCEPLKKEELLEYLTRSEA